MRSCSVLLLALLASDGPVHGQAESEEEILTYSVNWPSGLSLGESQFTSRKVGDGWELELTIQAGIPGFPVRDRFFSRATPDFCSIEFEKDSVHGKRKANERSSFDPAKGVVVRQTLGGGGRSEMKIEPCARDALAFVFFLRRELARGRLPASQTIYFGAPYQLRLQYAGTQHLVTEEARVETDRLTALLKGPKSETSFELYFARDAARTLMLVKVPFAMGTFSMELVR